METAQNPMLSEDVKIMSKPDLPPGVLEAYRNKSLVVFVGAGISRLMGCRGWDDMANDLIKKICKPATANQIIKSDLDSRAKITIARRYAEKTACMTRFWDIFSNSIKRNDQKDDIYQSIARIGSAYITTNCDGLLVKHFPTAFTTNCTQELFMEKEGQPFVFCIHGNYGEGRPENQKSLIFTVDEYLINYAAGSPLVQFLEYVMGKKTVLFLGYGLNEFEIISKAFQKDETIRQKHFILEGFYSYQQELANAQAAYYKSLGVQLIAYNKDDNDYEQQREILNWWIEQLIEKTPYPSRNVLNITDAVSVYSEGSEKIIIDNLTRKDALRPVNLKAVLEALPTSKDCYKWLALLISHHFVDAEHLIGAPKSEEGYYVSSDDVFISILRCPQNIVDEDESINAVKKYLLQCIQVIAENEEIIKNPGIRMRIIYLAFRFDLVDAPHFQELWNTHVYETIDIGYHALLDNIESVEKWPEESQVMLLSILFKAPEIEVENNSYYWFDHAAKLISEHTSKKVREQIAQYCFDQTNIYQDKKAFMHSLGDRFQFDSSRYDKSLYTALNILEESLPRDKRKCLCEYMLKYADTVFSYQMALHYAGKNKYVNIKAFSKNPLMIQSTFVEFFFWLEAIVNKLGISDRRVISDWIDEANFGYSLEDEERRDFIVARIYTYKYQLMSILAAYYEQYEPILQKFAVYADTEMKTPGEDDSAHYSIKMMDSENHLPDVIPKDFNQLDIYIEQAVKKSGWPDEIFTYPRIIKIAKEEYLDGHYASAANRSFVEVETRLRELFKELKPDATAPANMGSLIGALLTENGAYRFCDLSSQSGKDYRRGVQSLFEGSMAAYRNPSSHENLELTKADAFDQIVLASQLMKVLDNSKGKVGYRI